MKQSNNGSAPSRDTSIPDTPELLAWRKKAESNMLRQYGQKWMDDNKAMIDSQWEYVKTLL